VKKLIVVLSKEKCITWLGWPEAFIQNIPASAYAWLYAVAEYIQ